MKVQCINDAGWMCFNTGNILPGPAFLQICDAVDCLVAVNGILAYRFREWSNQLFQADQFIPLDTIPDTDTINEAERESIVSNPHVHPIFQDILKTALHV
jgi:hypothetical protein